MYKVIGVDGQQYGPLSVEQIRRWIAENRLNAQSLAQPEGSAEWKSLGTLPDFAGAFGGQPGVAGAIPPFAAPPSRGADAEAMAAAILARDYRLDIGRCVSRAWDLTMRHFWLMVGGSLVLLLISNAAGGLLHGVCVGCIYYFMLRLIRGQRTDFGQIFEGFSIAFLQLFLAGLVSSILTGVGLLLCLLPGIYLMVAWMFAFPLVVDKRLDFWPAMELSRKVITKHWWSFFGLGLVNILIVLAGFAVCGVGILVAIPVATAAVAYAYEDVFGTQANPGA